MKEKWSILGVLNNSYPQLTSRVCSDCGNFLLLTDKIVEVDDSQHLPVTTSTFKCSNKVCKDATEKKQAERVKKFAEQEIMKQARQEQTLANRRRKLES